MSALAGPIFFSLHEKPTTVYLPNELRAKAEDEARAASYRHLSPFLSSLVEKMLNFTFLDPKKEGMGPPTFL